MRRGEALALRWEHVELAAQDDRGNTVGEIHLPAEVTKKSCARWSKRVLSDVALAAGQDGPALAAALQRAKPELRVVLMSGFAPDPQRLQLVEDCEFLQKPFSGAELDALLVTRRQDA